VSSPFSVLKQFYFYYEVEDSTDLEENSVISSEMKMLKNLEILEVRSCWSNLVNFVEVDLVLNSYRTFFTST